ncbi:MAG: sigma-70 family RNA polymerase sigma factor, partial [Akkermansia sp.]|nr:sigma-70 family RNA polymerase sigma factor [Akkermansia sp.]
NPTHLNNMSENLKLAQLKELEDESLIQMTLAGVQRAYDELVKRHSRRLHSMLMQMLNSETDAYDIAQEAFVKAYRSLQSFNGNSAFYTWLYTIALNEARNFIRKENKRRKSSISIDNDVNGDPKEKNVELADSSREADPLRNANVGDLKTRLKYALSQLSPEHREVVQLCDIACMNYSEVASMLKIPEGTLRSRLHYAHRYLQSLLKDEL